MQTKPSLLLRAMLLLSAFSLGHCIEDNPDYCGGIVCDPFDLPIGGADLRANSDQGGAPDMRQPPGTDMASGCDGPADCASRVCLPDGSCANAADVIYVNNKNGTCSGAHAGTQADPVCKSAEGQELAKAKGKTRIAFAASVLAYEGLKIDGAMLNLYGPGPNASPRASLTGAGGVNVLAVLGGAVVTVDGMDIGYATQDVVLCEGMAATASLTLLRTRVHDAGDHGIYAVRCKLFIDRSYVHNNRLSGAEADKGSQLFVSNSFLYSNRQGAVHIYEADGRISFSTLVNNGAFGTAGAVECKNRGGTIEGSILVDNARGPNAVSATCKVQRSATDEATLPGGVNNFYNARPNFVNNIFADYRLRRSDGSNGCCIDKLEGTGTDPTIDVDETPRPQGVRWDIGAHEVK